MAVFADCNKRQWIVEINVGVLKRVRNTLKIDDEPCDLLKLIENKAFAMRISESPVDLVDILYVLCKTQADERKVSDEDFGRSLAGDALSDAVKALNESLANFYPSRKAALLKKGMAAVEAIQEKLLEKAEARLASGEMEKEIEREVEKEIERRRLQETSGAPSIDAQPSSELTPAP